MDVGTKLVDVEEKKEEAATGSYEPSWYAILKENAEKMAKEDLVDLLATPVQTLSRVEAEDGRRGHEESDQPAR